MKPIEPGCLAIITHGSFYGFSTIAVRHVPSGSAEFGSKTLESAWVIDPYPEGQVTDYPNVCAERYLMRIDDYDPSQDVVEGDKEVEA